MRSSLFAETGLRLQRSPSARQLATRRRLAVLGAVAALALASSLLGLLSAAHHPAAPEAALGPFSYFPSA